MSDHLIAISGVSKQYGGLRPLRLARLEVAAGEVIGLAGFDKTTAEVFVNLVTGATLPDEGDVRVFGRATADIVDSDDWLATVDRFGIVSERVVLLEQFTPLQNIAMSLTLDLEPLSGEVRAEAEALACLAGLDGERLERPVEGASAALRVRVRLARALATWPAVLLAEHPLAGLEPAEAAPLAAHLRAAAEARGLAVIVLAAEPGAASPFASRVLTLNGGTGELAESRTGLLGRLLGRS